MLKINNSGDTIVEVMIAVAIIGAVIIGATLSVNNSSATIQNSVYRQQATQLLQSQLELINAGNNESHNGGQTLNNLYASLNPDPATTFKHLCAYQGAGYLNTNRYYRSNDIVTQVDSSNNESTWFYSYGVGSHSGVSGDLDASFTIPYSSNLYTTNNSGTQGQKSVKINPYLFSFSQMFDSSNNVIGLWANSTYSSTTKYSLGNYADDTALGVNGFFAYINPISTSGHPLTDTTYWQNFILGNIKSSYSGNSSYIMGDIVIDHNNRYISIVSSNQGHKLNDTAYWLPMKNTTDSYNNPYYYDPAGIVGKSGVYYSGDVVSYNGDLYTVNQNLAATTTGDKPINGYGYWVPFEDSLGGTYSSTQSYSYGDIVNGYVYVANSPSVGQSQSNTTYWVKSGMLNPSTYSPATTYKKGDLARVSSKNYIYINPIALSGHTPTGATDTYWQWLQDAQPYDPTLYYAMGQKARPTGTPLGALNFIYINPVPQKGQPLPSFLPLNYMSYVDLGYKDLNNASPQEATTCNFDITGLNYIPTKSTNNPNLPNSPNSPFYSVDITITQDTTNLSLYKLTGMVNWNGIGSQGQNSKVTLQQTIVSK